MNPLKDLLLQRIVSDGPISVAAFMEAALLHPVHGYYRSRDAIGREGDFVTAPEISQVFGELVGAWCAMVWRSMGAPAPVLLVELGPGRGTLLADLWRTARAVAPDFAAALRLHLVEASPVLRLAQQQRLATLAPEPSATWHADVTGLWESLPDGPLLVIANEFFDALPLRQFVHREDQWRERLLDQTAGGDGLVFVEGPPRSPGDDAAADAAAALLPEAPEGAILELCPAAEAVTGALAARLAAQGGAALIIDYGPAASGPGDTLQAVEGHRRADPLAAPGHADLSHHVDFARLHRAALDAGAAAWGPVPQGLFLGRLGAGARAEALAAAATSAEQAQAILGAVRRLLHPGRMGVLFKVLAITGSATLTPPGFAADADAHRGDRR